MIGPENIVDIESADAGAGHRRTGSGIALSSRLVLTSVEAIAGGPVARIAGGRLDCRRIWTQPGTPAAGVLLEVPDSRAAGFSAQPIRWGLVAAGSAWVRCTLLSESPLEWDVNALAVTADGCWYPRTAGGTDSAPLWPGTPVMCGDLLIGVLARYGSTADPPPPVLPVATLATDPEFRALVQRFTGRPLRLEPAHLAGAFRPWLPAVPPPTPTALLRADYGILPFHGGDEPVRRLLDWCTSGPALAGTFVVGPAGRGRRRLARLVADELRDRGWAVGELRDEPADGWGAALAATRAPVLAIVDEAVERADQLRVLTRPLAGPGRIPALRILALTEDADAWWARWGDSPAVRTTFAHPPLVLRDIDRTGQPAAAAVQHALDAFIREPLPRFQRQPWHSRPETAGWYGTETDGRPLSAHLVALAAALTGTLEGPEAAADRVLAKELECWQSAAGTLSPEAERDYHLALAAALLLGAGTEEEAYGTLATILEPAVVPELAGWVRQLYPPTDPEGDYWGRLYPDELLDRFLVPVLTASDVLESALPAVTPRQAQTALSTLASAIERRSDSDADAARLRRKVLDVVARHPLRLAPELVSVAHRSPPAIRLLSSFLGHANGSEELYRAMAEQVPASAGPLAEIALWLRSRLVEQYQEAAEEGSTPARYLLASELAQSACILAGANRTGEAVEFARRAVDEYATLATSGPQPYAFRPAHAEAVSLYAQLLARSGKPAEALPAADEAVNQYRVVAATDPGFALHLARALQVLAAQVTAGRGDPDRAVDALREAATLCRAAGSEAATDEARWEPLSVLHEVLEYLAKVLVEMAHFDESITIRAEIVTTVRALRGLRPDEYEPQHIDGLTQLSTVEWMAGRHRDAVATLERAVALRRSSAERDQRSFLGLGIATTTLSDRLAATGRPNAAAEAAEEAVTYLGQAFRTDPTAARPALAAALHGLGLRLAEVDREKDSVEALREAADFYRQLREWDSARYTGPLRLTLVNLAAVFGALERFGPAADAAAEALQLFEGDHGRPEYAAALTNTAIALGGLDRFTEGVEYARVAAATYASTGRHNHEEYAKSLHVLARLLRLGNQVAQSVESAAELVRVREETADAKGLALALAELVRCLAAGERWAECAGWGNRALADLEALASADPGYRSDLGELSLLVMQACASAGQTDEADRICRQAIELYRQLTAERPTRYEEPLADALDALCSLPLADGSIEDRLRHAEEAVERRRELAAEDDPTQLDRLSAALRRLSEYRSAAGLRDSGLSAVREAVATDRRLNRIRTPEVPAPVAASRRMLSEQLALAVRTEEDQREALAAAQAALAESLQRPYRDSQTKAISVGAAYLTLSQRQREANEPAASLISAREAVKVLDSTEPTNHTGQDMLGLALTNLDLRLASIGAERERFGVATRAVEVYENLARAYPEFAAHAHAAALRWLSEVHAPGTLRRRRMAARQAVEIHRQLAAERPDTYRAEYVASLRALGRIMPRLPVGPGARHLRRIVAELDHAVGPMPAPAE